MSFFACIVCAYLDLTIDESEEFTIIKNNTDKVTTDPIQAIKNFRVEYWLCSIVYCLGISSIFPYINFSSEFLFKTKFSKIANKHLAETESDMFTGICFIICAMIDPFMGLIQKRFGLRPHLLFSSAFFGVIALCLFYVSPLIGIINLGLSNSILLTVYWTSIGLIVTKKDEVIKNFIIIGRFLLYCKCIDVYWIDYKPNCNSKIIFKNKKIII